MEPLITDDRLLARVASFFRSSPAELVGLVVLLTGALVASGLVWVSAVRRPAPPTAAVADVGLAVDEAGEAVGDDAAAAHGSAGGAAQDVRDGELLQAELTVYVTGAVAEPGVVRLPDGARVIDAVDAAGGMAGDVDAARVNLARMLADGEHVHLPRPGEDAPPGTDGSVPGGAVGADGRLDLNRATAAELESLPGIGPAKSSAIVEYREANGAFRVPGDIRGVPGIGEATFQRLAARITVG